MVELLSPAASPTQFPPGIEVGSETVLSPNVASFAETVYVEGIDLPECTYYVEICTVATVLAALTSTQPGAPSLLENRLPCTRMIPSCNHRRDQ